MTDDWLLASALINVAGARRARVKTSDLERAAGRRGYLESPGDSRLKPGGGGERRGFVSTPPPPHQSVEIIGGWVIVINHGLPPFH